MLRKVKIKILSGNRNIKDSNRTSKDKNEK